MPSRGLVASSRSRMLETHIGTFVICPHSSLRADRRPAFAKSIPGRP
jgi:hypothetical protein